MGLKDFEYRDHDDDGPLAVAFDHLCDRHDYTATGNLDWDTD